MFAGEQNVKKKSFGRIRNGMYCDRNEISVKTVTAFLISNCCRVVNVAFFLLGYSPGP
jgi:hypothetical protein